MTQRDRPAKRDAAFDSFLAAYPTYAETGVLDEVRAREFKRLDQLGQVYLDYTGAGLYAVSQVKRHGQMLATGVFGNPHSHSRPSAASTKQVEACRQRVLRFFHASPETYCVVFTGNASKALKLVGEAYPFESGDQFLLTFDNHNSVNGIREFDRASGARTQYIPVLPPDLVADDATVTRHLKGRTAGCHNLFAFPAQSNFSGVQHPLEWIARAQEVGWDVLVDAAAFVPTNNLDLSRWQPDYVAVSFYKMFGYPTGVGALIARRSALDKLRRPWFSGGTISVASLQADGHVMSVGAEAFEDGTPDYLNIPAVVIGLDLLESIGVGTVHERVRCLTGWLLDQLSSLRHPGGRPLVKLYGPLTTDHRGGTIALNFYGADSTVIDHHVVEALATRENIAIRTGCFCNPGAGEVALGLSETELTRCFRNAGDRMSRDDFIRCIDAESGGAVRVSFGLVSNFDDAHRFVTFARRFLTDSAQAA